jgi:2-methylisocitrate lyase-like PEP mutase family enzyme
MDKRSKLRQLLTRPGILIAPGCHDALGARIIEEAGFAAAYMTGNGVSASMAGVPDAGLLTMTEMVDQARRIASAIEIPLLCDADTGYGGIQNVMRTVREYEQAGVAGIHIEDQTIPKKCAAMEGLKLVSLEAAIGRIEAAREARRSKDFLIIARTDARVTHDLEEAVRRGKAFAKAGADLVFLELLRSEQEAEFVAKSLNAPLMIDMTPYPGCERMRVERLEAFGYKLAIYPLSSTLLYANATRQFMQALHQSRDEGNFLPQMMPLREYEKLLGLTEVEAATKRFEVG